MNARHLAVVAGVGAAAFAAPQYVLFALSSNQAATIEQGSGWFLNSGVGVAVVLGVLAAAAAVTAMATSRFDVLRGAGAFAGGAIAAMAVTLFIVGPGTIFPIVIVVGSLCIGIAALAGGCAGMALRSVLEPRAR
jgi:hypothetical protein